MTHMNATAAKLGMTRTVFANANGLPAPEQVTTARDLAKLTQAVLRDYPNSAPGRRSTCRCKRRLRSHNALLTNYDGADGIKTGFICDSGFNIVASATRDGRRLVAVVLGEVTGRERRRVRPICSSMVSMPTAGNRCSCKLDTMPVAADAKGVVSIRHAVISWACGTGRRRPSRDPSANGRRPLPPPRPTRGPEAGQGSGCCQDKAGAEGPAKQDKGAAAAKTKAKPQGDKTSATTK